MILKPLPIKQNRLQVPLRRTPPLANAVSMYDLQRQSSALTSVLGDSAPHARHRPLTNERPVLLPLIGGTVAVSDTLFTLELANTVMRQMNGGQLLTAGISVTVLSNVDGTAAHRLPPPLSVTSEARC